MIIRMCRIMKLLILVLTSLTLLGCNSTKNSEQQVAGNSNDRVICESVASVGSHMKRRVCKSQAQKEKEAEEAQRYLRQERRVVNTGK